MQKADAKFSIAARFKSLIRFECAPYRFDSTASVITSQIALSSTRELDSAERYVHFFIFDRRSRHGFYRGN